MAILTLKLPDEIAQRYAEHDGNVPQRAMERQLIRWADFSPTARTVLLSDETRRAVEKLYGQPIEDQAEFVRWLQRMISARVGEQEFPLSEGQIKRARGNAEFWHLPVEEYLRQQIRTAIDNALGGAD